MLKHASVVVKKKKKFNIDLDSLYNFLIELKKRNLDKQKQ